MYNTLDVAIVPMFAPLIAIAALVLIAVAVAIFFILRGRFKK